jgi:hypothetical protein
MRRVLIRGLVVLCALAFAPAAFAHHPVISGSFSCDGVVSYTATAWATSSGLPGSRTNSDIRIYYNQLNGIAVTPVQIGNGAFDQANSFAFSGTYNLQANVSSSVSSVRVTAVDAANWGNGTAPSGVTPSGSGGDSQSTVVINRSTSGCTPPSIQITKLERVNGNGSFVVGPLTGNVGDTVNYEMTVTAGPTALSAVTLSDPMCDAGTISPAGPQSLQANQSLVYTCLHKLTPADGAVGSYSNTASVTGNGPPPPSTPVSATSQTVVVKIPPSITIAKAERINGSGSFVVGPLAGSVGDAVNYQMTVTAGQTPLTAVTLSDPKCDSGTLSPSGPQSMQANQPLVFTCLHTLTAADLTAGSYTNTASVTGMGPNNTPVSAGPVSVVVTLSSGGGGTPTLTATPTPSPTQSVVQPTPSVVQPTPSVVSPTAKPEPKAKPKPKGKHKPKHKAVFKPPVVKPKPAPCYVVSVASGSLTAGSHAALNLRVTGGDKGIPGVRVEVKGAGILKLSGRTNAAGKVTMNLTPMKPGIVVIKPASHPSCANKRIGVVGAFSPPVTG